MKTCWAKVKDYILACISVILLYVLAAIWIPKEWLLPSSAILGVLLWFTLIITYSYKRTKSSFSLLTLLDVAMLVLFGALIALVVAVTMGKISITDDNSTAYVIITFTLTMAALIPYLISRTIAKSEIDNMVDEKVGKLFNQKIAELEQANNTSLYNLTKQSAHSARITADMLKKDNTGWAIGWASQSLIRYMQINYNPASGFYGDCMKIISECLTQTPSSDNANNGEDNKLDRAYTDLLDMYLFYHQYSKTNFMQDDHEQVYNAVNEYSQKYTLDKLFEKSKLFEYDSAKLDKAKQKEVFEHLIHTYKITTQK